MTARRWIGILSMVVGGTIGITAAQGVAAAGNSAPKDITVGSAGALVEVCTVAPSDADSSAQLGFCYGFFEGAIQYHGALAGANINRDLVCAPAGTTRQQGVEAFISFMQENPGYESEASIDAVIRALAARWPCDNNS